MSIQASLNNYRVSPLKARLLADQIRGRRVEEALTFLDLSTKRFARPLAKLVRSALANAEHENEKSSAGIDIDTLVISQINVDQGPSMWRIRARAQGRASWLQKKTSNVRIVLSEN